MKRIIRGYTPLFDAVEQGHFTAVKCLVENGADTENTGGLGFTPLYIAVENGRLDIVKYLISKKANIFVKTKLNGGLLHVRWAIIYLKLQNTCSDQDYHPMSPEYWNIK